MSVFNASIRAFALAALRAYRAVCTTPARSPAAPPADNTALNIGRGCPARFIAPPVALSTLPTRPDTLWPTSARALRRSRAASRCSAVPSGCPSLSRCAFRAATGGEPAARRDTRTEGTCNASGVGGGRADNGVGEPRPDIHDSCGADALGHGVEGGRCWDRRTAPRSSGKVLAPAFGAVVSRGPTSGSAPVPASLGARWTSTAADRTSDVTAAFPAFRCNSRIPAGDQLPTVARGARRRTADVASRCGGAPRATRLRTGARRSSRSARLAAPGGSPRDQPARGVTDGVTQRASLQDARSSGRRRGAAAWVRSAGDRRRGRDRTWGSADEMSAAGPSGDRRRSGTSDHLRGLERT